MLISHRYKFIFIKTMKTAGTSVEVVLSRLMGDADIVTPIYPAVDGHRARNHEHRSLFGLRKSSFYNHMPAEEVRRIIGTKVFSEYFKFCVEREPVDKCISHYSMLMKSPHHNRDTDQLTWEDYLEKGDFPIDTRKYTDAHDALLVDEIIPYEGLEDGLHAICTRLGLDFRGLNASAKSGFRVNPAVSEHQRDTIYKAFESSNRHTGYGSENGRGQTG